MNNPYALLPPSIRHDERCRMFADVCQRLDELPIGNELIYKLDTTIPDSLPHLAEQFFMQGSEGWDFCLTDIEKRNIIRQAIQLKKLKGTIAGYRAIARIAGARLPHYIAPPAIPYLGAKLGEQERSKFLSRYPKMRTYRYRTQGKKVGAMLWKCIPKNNAGYKATYPTPQVKQYLVRSDAIDRFQERAFIQYPDSKEIPLITYERVVELEDSSVTTHIAARIPGIAYGLFLGRKTVHHRFADKFTGKRFLVVHDLAFRSFIVNFTEPYQYKQDEFRKTVQPAWAWNAIDVTYQEVKEHGQRRGMFLDCIYPTPPIHPVTPVQLIAPLICLDAFNGQVVQFASGHTPALGINPSAGKGSQVAAGESPSIAISAALAKVSRNIVLSEVEALELAAIGMAVVVYFDGDVATGLTPSLEPDAGIGSAFAVASQTGLTPSLNLSVDPGLWMAIFSRSGLSPALNPIVEVGSWTAAASGNGITPVLNPVIEIGAALASKSGDTANLNPMIDYGLWSAAQSVSGITPVLSPASDVGSSLIVWRVQFNNIYGSQYLGAI